MKREIYNILDYGAIPNSSTKCTKAIQQAIDNCKIGGIVYIPPGVFVSGALYLHSGIKIYLEKGAVLKGSTQIEDYPIYKYRYEGVTRECYSSLINTKPGYQKDITIYGGGIIDGSGDELFQKELENYEYCRGRVICIRNTTNCVIDGITVCNTLAWTVHFIFCKNIKILNTKIFSKRSYDKSLENVNLKNGDGIVIDSCCEAQVCGCIIESQDDCISIKSGKDSEGIEMAIPSKNIVINDNLFLGGAGVSIGSEMSGGVTNVKIELCDFINVWSILSIKSNRERGGFIENVIVKQCRLINKDAFLETKENYKAAIYMDLNYKISESDHKINRYPDIRNILINNLYIINTLGGLAYLRGIPEAPVKNVVISEIESYSRGEIDCLDVQLKAQNIFNNGKELKLG